MVFINQKLWVIIAAIQLLIIHAFTQMVMPVFPSPMFALPQIHIIAMPNEQKVTTTTTTTTTTTEGTMAVAVPVPVPMPLPVQFAVPAPPPPPFCQGSPRPRGCPPCPPCLCAPSCTPAFFSYCSPCHQKCRCRNSSDAPVPQPLEPPMPVQGPAFPMPVPGPPFSLPVPQPAPIVMAPYPQFRWLQRSSRPKLSDYSDSRCDSESGDSSSFSERYVAKRRRMSGRNGRRRRQRIKRRNMHSGGSSGGEFVKPALTFLSKNGDIKMQEKLSSVEAEQLLDGKSQEHQIMTSRGSEQQPLEESINEDMVSFSDNNLKQVFIGNSNTGSILKNGKKELIFRTPVDKKITNVSLSFQVV